MNEPSWMSFIDACKTLLDIGFFAVIAMIGRYLISVWKLINDLKSFDTALWNSMGSPDLFSFSRESRSLAASETLFRWYMQGAEGATSGKVRSRATETRRRFRQAAYFSAVFVVILAVTLTSLKFMTPDSPTNSPAAALDDHTVLRQ